MIYLSTRLLPWSSRSVVVKENTPFDFVLVAHCTGSIPEELAQLTSLTALGVANNKLDGESDGHNKSQLPSKQMLVHT